MQHAPILVRGSAFFVLGEMCTTEPEGSATQGYGSKSPAVHRPFREPSRARSGSRRRGQSADSHVRGNEPTCDRARRIHLKGTNVATSPFSRAPN
jgi:hypothetical protein